MRDTRAKCSDSVICALVLIRCTVLSDEATRRMAPRLSRRIPRLCRDRQLTDRFTLLKHQTIHLFTLVESAKRLACLTFIAVNLPAAAAFAIPAVVLNIAHDIAGRIAQKETNLMRKFSGTIDTFCEVRNGAFRRKIIIAKLFEYAGSRFAREISRQFLFAVDIDQRAARRLADDG